MIEITFQNFCWFFAKFDHRANVPLKKFYLNANLKNVQICINYKNNKKTSIFKSDFFFGKSISPTGQFNCYLQHILYYIHVLYGSFAASAQPFYEKLIAASFLENKKLSLLKRRKSCH